MRLSCKTIIVLASLLLAGAARAADPLEGRWQVNGGGALIEFEASAGTDKALIMRWIDGPDLSIAEGAEIAMVYPSTTVGVYDCIAEKDPRDERQAKKRGASFVIKISDDNPNVLSFEAYENKTRISLWRWLPYMFRVSVVREKKRPNNLEGARRVGSQPSFITI